MATFEGALLILAGVAAFLFLLYVLYGLIFRAFQRVGFTQGEAAMILGGTLVLGFFNVPLLPVGEWVLAINLGGAAVPVVVSVLILRRSPGIVLEALVGVVFVAGATYAVTRATPEGIVSPFPLWLVPPLVAALLSMAAFWREEAASAPLAYVSGTLGTLLGADGFRLGEFLAQAPPESGALASIGGGSVFDMVFLAGVIAVSLDMAMFRERRRAGSLAEEGGPVFTVHTSAEAIRDYLPATQRRK